jgi:hypothetical protein
MTCCQWRPRGRRRPAPLAQVVILLLSWSLCVPWAAAQGLADDPDLRRLRDGASRLRELQGWGAPAEDSPRSPGEAAVPAESQPADILPPSVQPAETESLIPAPAAVPPEPMLPSPSEEGAGTVTPEQWQALLWRQDLLSYRVDAELGELTGRLTALEERTEQLSVTLFWLSGGILLLLILNGAAILRLRRRPPVATDEDKAPSLPPAPYLPQSVLPQENRLAACELLLLSGHYRQCLQESRAAAASARPAEQPLLAFLEAAALRLLGEDSSASERRLHASVQKASPCQWPLHEIDSWLLLAEMAEQDRSHLGSLVEYLRPAAAEKSAKENPSGAGGVFSG